MTDGTASHLEGRLETLRCLTAAGPQTAYALAQRLGVSEGHARQRLKRMQALELVDVRRSPGGTTEYLPTAAGQALLRESTPELPAGSSVVLVFEPVVGAVRARLWRRIVERPPLWLVRSRGAVSWMVICRSSADADELADALSAAGDPHRAACVAVVVEGTALATDLEWPA